MHKTLQELDVYFNCARRLFVFVLPFFLEKFFTPRFMHICMQHTIYTILTNRFSSFFLLWISKQMLIKLFAVVTFCGLGEIIVFFFIGVANKISFSFRSPFEYLTNKLFCNSNETKLTEMNGIRLQRLFLHLKTNTNHRRVQHIHD